MPLKPSRPHYDVVIVGSGVAGALVAKRMGIAGKSVLILEAGLPASPNINTYMNRFYNSNVKVPETPYPPELFTQGAITDPGTLNAGRPTVLSLTGSTWRDPKQSYLIQMGPRPFTSTYTRVTGGTAMHWLGTSLRLLPADFKMRSTYQLFEDWPLSYEDLEPWYRKAECELGVSADVNDQTYLGIKFAPGYDYPMAAIPQSRVDAAVGDAIEGMTVDGVVLKQEFVRSTPAARNSQPYQSRRVCAGNTNCIPICPIQAKYDPTVTLNDAQATGKVELCSRTVVSEIVLDESGRRIRKIKYMQYEDPAGPRTASGSVTGDVVVIAAHAIETPKLLLMSKNGGRTPSGLANSSGLVGKNLMDHPYWVPWGLLPRAAYPYRGPLSTAGIEELRDGIFRAHRAAYRIEIGNEGWNFVLEGDPNITTVDVVNGMNNSGTNPDRLTMFGKQLTGTLNNTLTKQFRLGFLVEQSPEETNRVELSCDQLDNLGLPRPQIRYDLSNYTKLGIAAAKKTADEIFKRMGVKSFTKDPKWDDPSAFEVAIDGKSERLSYMGAGHIMGTYRMGTSRSNSVVNRDQLSWDHDRLYLIGSGVFPTSGTANPTLTLAALALRTADAILKNDFKQM